MIVWSVVDSCVRESTGTASAKQRPAPNLPLSHSPSSTLSPPPSTHLHSHLPVGVLLALFVTFRLVGAIILKRKAETFF